MTSPKNAVSLLTAAALVVAPVGGVAATYDTGYADDGGDKGKDEDGSLAIPDSAEQAIEWIQSGKRGPTARSPMWISTICAST